MEGIEPLGLLFRWAHILAAVTAVGGSVFMRFALLPSVAVLTEEQHALLREQIRSRWAKAVMISILFLLVSGFYNFITNVTRYELPGPYHALFGIKFLLALAIFFIASLLTGKSDAAVRFRQNARTWLNLNLVLAVILICISGVLGKIEKVKKPASPAGQSTRIEGSFEVPFAAAEGSDYAA